MTGHVTTVKSKAKKVILICLLFHEKTSTTLLRILDFKLFYKKIFEFPSAFANYILKGAQISFGLKIQENVTVLHSPRTASIRT